MTPAGPDTMERPVCACWLIAENGAISKHCLLCLRPVSYGAQLLWPRAFVRGWRSCASQLHISASVGKGVPCCWDSCSTRLQYDEARCAYSQQSLTLKPSRTITSFVAGSRVLSAPRGCRSNKPYIITSL